MRSLIEDLNRACSAWEAMLPAYRRLSDYYQSEQWMADHEASNAGELPEGLLCGVLSEDAVYDLFID